MIKLDKKVILFGLIIIFCVCGILLYKSTQKIVYMEYIKLDENCDSSLKILNNNSKIEQEFKIPYQMFSGVGLIVEYFNQENNSKYEVVVKDKTANKEITSFVFYSNEVENNSVNKLLLNSPIKVDNTHTFSIIIQAISKENDKNYVAFGVDEYTGSLKNEENQYNSTLCMNIYGGNTNIFWFLFTLGCEIYVLGLLIYIIYLYINQKSIKQNILVQVGILGIIVFLTLSLFAKQQNFIDEVDNIIGGMLITKGKILYKDYYIQHTPIAYFLCAILSLCQAESVEQFRLIYYVLITFVWMGLYIRHKDNFGKTKMILLPILQIILGVAIASETTMILSDNIQAICMIALVLEFLQYLKDEKIDWKRSIIVSLSIFFSFGSAFISVYQIFAICLGVVVNEIIYWVKNKKITLKKCLQRYWKLIVVCIIPFVVVLIYFVLTNSLNEAYEQAYKFNTEVYSYYTGLGDNIIAPFLIGTKNFIQIIPDSIQNIFTGKDVNVSIIKLLVGIEIFFVVVKMICKKEYFKSIILVMFMEFGFIRDSFHLIAFWSSVLIIILVEFNYNKKSIVQKKIESLVLTVLTMFLLVIFIDKSTVVLLNKIKPISIIEQKVIEETVDGETIFIDLYSCLSVYLIYKDRFPVNRVGFILPWYMDWYEVDTIEDLEKHHPRVCVYNENAEVWKITNFANYLKEYLNKNYEKIDENGLLWISK